MDCRECGTILTEANWWLSDRKCDILWCISCHKKANQRSYFKHRKDRMKRSKEWIVKNRLRHNYFTKKSDLRRKLKVMIHYSSTNPPQCANPFGEHKEPYTNIRALSMDLIKGGHRRSGIGLHSYVWLINNNYPDGWQVLCMNCQWIKRDVNRELID